MWSSYLWQGLSSVDCKVHWLRKVIWRDQAGETGEEGRPEDYLLSDFKSTRFSSQFLLGFRIFGKKLYHYQGGKSQVGQG